MKPLAILNDNHIGVIRANGTTPQTELALRKFGINMLRKVVEGIDTDLAINGDLFDGYQIPLADALETLQILQAFLQRGNRLYLIPGNHDLSKDSSKLSTFEFVAKVLCAHPGASYHPEPGFLRDGIYVVPHRTNQDLFDFDLSQVPPCKYLLLHCNWNNSFAKESDHSLNLDADVARALPAERIIMGHEHVGTKHLDGKVWIAGCQWPMSVSDCLDEQDKRMLFLTEDGVRVRKTWDRMGFQNCDWKQISDLRSDSMFVRLTGTASEVEATDLVNTVASLRRASDAYIITSAVRVTGAEGEDIDLSQELASAEDVRAFDVMAALRDKLSEKQMNVIDSLK